MTSQIEKKEMKRELIKIMTILAIIWKEKKRKSAEAPSNRPTG